MNTITVILDFFSCSVMLGAFYRQILDLRWLKENTIKLPKTKRREQYFFMAITLLLSAYFLFCSWRRGSFNYWGCVACLANAYFVGYALWLKRVSLSRYIWISLLPSVLLLLAIIFNNAFWIITSVIVIVILFGLGEWFQLFIEDDWRSYWEAHRSWWNKVLLSLKDSTNDTEELRAFLREAILSTVKSIFGTCAFIQRSEKLQDIREDSSLTRDLGLSIEDLEYARVLWEKAFLIEISDKELFSDKIQTIQDVVDLIGNKISEKIYSLNKGC